MTSDGAPTTPPETGAISASNHGLRYTPEELTTLRPASMPPKGPPQSEVPASGEGVAQDQTSAKLTVPDVNTGVEQQLELTREPTAIVSDKGEDNRGLDVMTKKRPSIAEGMEDENGEAVKPTETQEAGPSQGASKKKKKKKKSSGKKKKKPNPTGFEEFYADPPITPEDHKEEVEQLYHL